MGIHVLSGWKFCPSCKIEYQQRFLDYNTEIEGPEKAETFASDDESDEWRTAENKDIMNSTLKELELTPFKVHAVPAHMKVAHGKRKLAQVNTEVSKGLATVLNVKQPELDSSSASVNIEQEQEIFQKANDLDKLC